jgi:hypothetical protein
MPDGLESPPALADPALLTAEEQRLLQARAGVPWRAWGTLSQRAPVGDGPGRLQRQRGCLVVFQS